MADPSETDYPPSDSGQTWAIFTSRDRLTDRPLFGARFGNASGNQLFSVLCSDDRSALALRRGLLPASKGASGDGNGIVSTIVVGERVAAREGGRVELIFDDGPPELFEIHPKHPVDFLRRVADGRRIQTTADDFDPKVWAGAIERVLEACRFEKRPGLAASPGKSQD